MSSPHIAVVGAGLGGLRTAEALRSGGFGGTISLCGAEQHEPYDRPPLSKQVLTGAWEHDRIQLTTTENLRDKLGLDLHLGRGATQLDAASRTVSFSDGSKLRADAVVVATGARARVLPGADPQPNTYVVRTLADCLRLREAFVNASRVAVIGAGFIGAEIAAAARAADLDVTILEALPVPLQRQLGDEMGAACGALHARHGTMLRTGVQVAGIEPDGVRLGDGEQIGADVVVVGIGAAPEIEWLSGSGLRHDPVLGLHCDDHCRALGLDGVAVAGVVGVGDVASWPNARYAGEQMRIEHWTNAAEMGMHAAETVLHDLGLRDADPGVYVPVPYFWSDQYDHKIQFLGRITGFEEVRVVAGSVEDGSWLAFYRRGDRIVGALGVTKMRLLMKSRKLLLDGASWDEAIEVAAGM